MVDATSRGHLPRLSDRSVSRGSSHYPGEGLYDAGRCGVVLSAGGDDLESVEHPSEIVGCVAGVGPPRAALRSVPGEGGDDDVTPRMNGFTQQIDIAIALFALHEEVEDGPVVPQPVAASRLPHQQILVEPLDAPRSSA